MSHRKQNCEENGEAGDHVHRVLSETGRLLAEVDDFDATLRNVAGLVVPRLAAWCVIDMVVADQLVPAVAKHNDPAKTDLIYELRQAHSLKIEHQGSIESTLRSGRAVLCDAEQRFPEAARDEQRLRMLRDLHFESGVVMPLVARGHRLGTITLVSERSNHYTEGDLPLLEELGCRCGAAVSHARSHRDLRRELTDHRRTQQSLRREQERRTAILEAALDCIISTDKDGRIADFNPAAERTFGYRSADVRGRYVADLIIPERLRDAHWRGLRRFLETGEGSLLGNRIEMPALHADGHEFPVELGITYTGVDGDEPFFTAYLRDISERKRAEHARVTQAEERERRRFAAMLHDHLQQLLVAGRFHATSLRQQVQDPGLRKRTDELCSMLDEAIGASRDLTAQFTPPVLYQRGLVSALQWLRRWMEDKHKLTVAVEAAPGVELENEDLRVFAFGAVRELLFNAAKHAGVNAARVHLRRHARTHLEIRVSDTGGGFDADRLDPQRPQGGHGLWSIRERVELLGGQIRIDSAPASGTAVTLLVPLSRPA